MTETQDRGAALEVLLWCSVAVALLTEADLFAARVGLLVGSPIALVIPGLAALVLVAVTLVGFRTWNHRDRIGWGLALVLLAYVAALVVLSLVPPVARDELTYHLAMPQLFSREGIFKESLGIAYSYFPMLLELQFMPLLAIGSATSTKLLHMLYGLASVALVFRMLTWSVGLRAAATGAVLLLTTPTVAILATRAYVDLAVLFYAAVAFFAVQRWHENDRLRWLILAGLAAGCVVGVKYSGLMVVAFMTLGVTLLAAPSGLKPALRSAVVFAGFAAIPALPWLVKNWMLTGNPVFPFFGEIFGGSSFHEMARLDPLSRRRWQYGESWLEIALSPIRIFITGKEGDMQRFDGVFNPLYLLGFAGALRREATRRDGVFALIAAIFLPAVFFSHDFAARYLVVILIPLTILTVEALARMQRQSGIPIVAALCVAALLFNVAHFALYWREVDPLALLNGTRTREEFIHRYVPEYPVVQYANANLGPTSLTYHVFLGDRSYYWETPFVYDQIYYASGVRLRAALGAADGCGVARTLRSEGVTHIAASEQLLVRFLKENLDEDERRSWIDFQASYLRPVFRQGGYGLYEVVAVSERGECVLRGPAPF